MFGISNSLFAFNPVQGIYFGLMGGGSYTPDIDYTTVNPINNINSDGELVYFGGGNGGFELGYRMKNFRIEGQGLFNYNKLERMQFGNITLPKYNAQFDPTGINGQTYLLAGFINGFFDCLVENASYAPYIGIGLGQGSVSSEFTFYSANNLFATVDKSDSVGAYQGIIGLGYHLDDYLFAGLDYRYIRTGKVSTLNSSYVSQTLNLSLNLTFDLEH